MKIRRSILILFMVFISFALCAPEVLAATLYVVTNTSQCPTVTPTPPCYTSIQAAINAATAADSDTILVERGTYSGGFTLKTGIPIRGRETAKTLISGGSPAAVIATDVTNCSLTNFTIINATVGVAVSNTPTTASSVGITNNVFQGVGTAIRVQISNGTTTTLIINNTFAQNGTAISTNVDLTIKNNIFFNNTTRDIDATNLNPTSITFNAFSVSNPGITDLPSSNITGVNPLFVDSSTTRRDFHLEKDSPCINKGDTNITDSIDTTVSDIGAYGGNNNLDSIPYQVSGVSVTESTADSITLTWSSNDCYLITTDSTVNAGNPRGYRVYYGSNGPGKYDGSGGGPGSPIKLDLKTTTVPPYTLSGLTPAVTAPEAPTLIAVAFSNNSLTPSWLPVAGATGYKVFYGTSSPPTTPIAVGNVTSFTIPGLVNGQTYYIAVSAYSQTTYYIAVTAYDNTNQTLDPGVQHESMYSQEVTQSLGDVMESGLSNILDQFPEAVIPYPSLPNSGCFIATAAYGYYSAPQVMALREFRDQYLLTNAPGRAFVRWYYAHGPAAAQFINDHPRLKPVVRAALLPAVAGALFLTRTSLTTQIVVLLLLTSAAGYAAVKIRTVRCARKR